ncbi:MAG TPA: hypothetical protein VGY55_19135 [Pirellulales bacterium]|jgi:hypothetical protein|nr:hypothetical protein [Pirellulales bacterium]
MASPFSIFRKNQRLMLAAVTILSMIGFVFFVPFGRGGNGPRGGGQGVEVATWKFGTIYKSDVDNRLYARRLVNEFIQYAFSEARSKGGFLTGRRPPQPFPNDASSMLTTILLQKKAEQMGIAVSDAAINDFIDTEVTDNKLSGAEELAILQKFNTPTQTRLSQDQLFDALRFELQARNLERLLISDVGSPGTPEQRYDYFSRLYRKATIQVMPVAVKDFADKVPDPTDNELRAFFEKYKDDLSNPISPEPGFKEPTRAKFQYFLAKQEDLIKEEKPKVTNDEIKDYYEKHKEQFRKSADEGTDSSDKSKKPDTSAKPDAAIKPDAAGKSDQKSDTTEKKPDVSAGGKTNEPGKDAGKDATGAARSAEKPAPDKDAGTIGKPAAAKPADKEPADNKAHDAKAATGSGKSAALAPSSRHRAEVELIALADGPPPAAPASGAAKDGVKPDAAPPATKTTDKSPTANKPVAGAANVGANGKSPDGEKPAAPKTEGPKTETPKSTVPGTGNPDVDLKPNEAPKKIPIVEYESLDSEKVRDEIRTSLAREKVGQQIDDAFKALSTEISTYRRKHSAWAVKKEGEAPTLPDFRALAKAKGLKFEETGLISAQQAYDTTELGKSFSFNASADGQPQQAYFVQQAFHANIPNYSPYTMFSSDDELNFLWWRVDYREAFVPDFEKVKPEVIEAWKMVEARKLALAQAKEYADQANKQHSELKEMFQFEKNLHVSPIGPFTWMSQLSVAQNPEQPAPLQMTQLSGVDKAGDEFMRTVFGLDGGSAGVAMNEPQTIAYVIQAISFDPAETVFRREFLNRMANPFGDVSLQTAQGDAYQALRAKMSAIRAEFDFKPAPGTTAQAATPSPSGDDSDD